MEPRDSPGGQRWRTRRNLSVREASWEGRAMGTPAQPTAFCAQDGVSRPETRWLRSSRRGPKSGEASQKRQVLKEGHDRPGKKDCLQGQRFAQQEQRSGGWCWNECDVLRTQK